MIPTVGRIVHYTSLGDADGKYPSGQQAAIITKVFARDVDVKTLDEANCKVSLHIFYETGDFFMTGVPFSPEYKRGHWTWPPKIG